MRIEDYGLIGDLQTAALVGRDGTVDWLCLPRFDSPSCFAALLGDETHGQWRIAPAGEAQAISRRYRPGTLVLETEFESGFLDDFANLLKRLVPSETYYAHDDWDRRTENICEEDMDFGNGHSHCMAMLLGTAGESVPVCDGDLGLGTWQRVLFIELDRQRDRRWIVKVVGT